MDEPGERDALGQLAGRVIGPRRRSSSQSLPSPELCEVALRLAATLDAYERDGGTAHRADVLAADEFRAVVVLARCRTALPRPQGRWEVALSDGDDDEWVIGEAGGGWAVEGLERLTGGTRPEHRVGVDRAGASSAPSPARRVGMRRRVTVGWHRDPEERHDLRYFDGLTWTSFVLDAATADG